MVDLPAGFRPATKADCRRIAELFVVASDGVSEVVWRDLAGEHPGLTPVEIGAIHYAREDTDFSYRSVVIAERDGEVIGILASYAVPLDANAEPAPNPPVDVLDPYKLEAPGSWYVCAMAVEPPYRGTGIGTRFLGIAADQARSRGVDTLSLLVFQQNVDAMRLYTRHGYREVDRRPVVPHPLIHYTGDIVLMTRPASTIDAGDPAEGLTT